MTVGVPALRFAVIGDPIAHSLSPRMHMAAFASLGLPHTYEALRVGVGELASTMGRLRGGEFAGFNVTIPHKTRVMELVDEVHESARAVGAANTIVRGVDGRLTAMNTDVEALGQELVDLKWAPGPGPGVGVLVLGSGGGARAAVAAAVMGLGAGRVVVAARGFDGVGCGAAFVADMRARISRPFVLAAVGLGAVHGDFACIVQATSAGMTGGDAGEEIARVVPWDELAKGVVAIDLVYSPAVTPFLAAAAARGIPCRSGLGMLARQGELAFEAWLGVKAPLAVMPGAVSGS